MKKNIILIYFILLTAFTTYAQSTMPLVPAPTDKPIFKYTSPDNFRATKIVEAKIGNDGRWYCLVKMEALGYRDANGGSLTYISYPEFSNGLYIKNPNVIGGTPMYFKCNTAGFYDPNTPGQNEVSLYKSYNQYKPTGENGYFIWLKANYLSNTQVGIVDNPGSNGIPPFYSGENVFDVIYNLTYFYKNGLLPPKTGHWYVSMDAFPNGIGGGRGQNLVVELLTTKPQ
ncbi:hypothetical protein MUB18_08205 [Sphingobacterium sp. PCS056]|uniref:hypothetical protein n=1 Tax=Sphingobacterium sp. PCS056 TaxID=2931400 RepID=UPI00200F4EE4|nr:hypothetical protein [Sphingobacterium sp. PCS056]UPZ38280.1 hypothetical protein MUB18_08205 [Sphingobacterium sp. PCS056]